MSVLDGNESLLDELRRLRHAIAERRLADTLARYPEIAPTDCGPLSDAALVRLALLRELGHAQQVAKDMGGISLAVERGR